MAKKSRKLRSDFERNFVAVAAMLRARPDATNAQIFSWFGGKLTERTIDKIAPLARKKLNLPPAQHGRRLQPAVAILPSLRRPILFGTKLIHPPACNVKGRCVCGLGFGNDGNKTEP